MKLLAGFPTEQAARAKSEALFVPFKHSTSRTTYLVGWTQNPQTLGWALRVPPAFEAMLPAPDLAALVPDDWPVAGGGGGGAKT